MIWIFLGVLILVGLFGGLFAVVAKDLGWREAAACYAFSIAATGVVALAVWLITLGAS